MTNEIYLAGGCFWGTQHYLKQIRGVLSTATGYANGRTDRPTYEEVYTDATGFAETVQVVYDDEVLSTELLIRLYFKAIDPTALNRQGNDRGTRYRTGIYFVHKEDEEVAQRLLAEEQTNYDKPLQVEVERLHNFFPAEEYHQDYLQKHPEGYCHLPVELFAYARKANLLKE